MKFDTRKGTSVYLSCAAVQLIKSDYQKISNQQRLRPACTSEHSDQNFLSPKTEIRLQILDARSFLEYLAVVVPTNNDEGETWALTGNQQSFSLCPLLSQKRINATAEKARTFDYLSQVLISETFHFQCQKIEGFDQIKLVHKTVCDKPSLVHTLLDRFSGEILE